MGQAAQALIDVAVDAIPVAHQPVAELLAEHALHHLAAAPPDYEERGGGAGEHPQPQHAPVLLPAGFIGIEQLDVAHVRQDLLLDHGLNRARGLLNVLLDGGGGQRQTDPVSEEFAYPRPGEAHALCQRTDEGNQGRSGEMLFAQSDRPSRILGAACRPRARPMPAGAASPPVDGLGLVPGPTSA